MKEWQKAQNESYRDYLLSDAWRKKRDARLKIDGGVCQGCGTRGNPKNPLAVHHLHYRTIGREDPYSDLVTLCEACHSIVHGMLNRTIDQEGRRGWSSTLPISTVHDGLQISTTKKGAWNDGSVSNTDLCRD